MMKPEVKISIKILRILCAMVFLSVGFAHRTPVAVAFDALSVAYSLPDGSFVDLCIADRGQKHDKAPGDCEACRLAGTVLLPSPGDHGWLLSNFASLGTVKPRVPAVLSTYSLDRLRLRGPPLSA
jgi:hypothetical protein